MNLLVLPGDGIGPEIVAAALTVLNAANSARALGLSFEFDEVDFASLDKTSTTLRDEVLQRARGADGVILGTQSHADYPVPEKGGHNVSAGFRVGLDLYANVRRLANPASRTADLGGRMGCAAFGAAVAAALVT